MCAFTEPIDIMVGAVFVTVCFQRRKKIGCITNTGAPTEYLLVESGEQTKTKNPLMDNTHAPNTHAPTVNILTSARSPHTTLPEFYYFALAIQEPEARVLMTIVSIEYA